MAEYWKFDATADLDAYVEMRARGRAGRVAGGRRVWRSITTRPHGRGGRSAGGLSIRCPAGSVHWVGGWRFDDLDDPDSMAEWSAGKSTLLGGLHRGAGGTGRVGRL